MKDLLYAIGFGLAIMLAFAACSNEDELFNEEEQFGVSGTDSLDSKHSNPDIILSTDWSDEGMADKKDGDNHRAPAKR